MYTSPVLVKSKSVASSSPRPPPVHGPSTTCCYPRPRSIRPAKQSRRQRRVAHGGDFSSPRPFFTNAGAGRRVMTSINIFADAVTLGQPIRRTGQRDCTRPFVLKRRPPLIFARVRSPPLPALREQNINQSIRLHTVYMPIC